MKREFDIIVVGGGVVGATTALALAKQTGLQIAILDSKSPQNFILTEHYHPRVSAISLASQRIFHNLSVWQHILAKRVSPFRHMYVWEDQVHIQFDANNISENQLGYIIEDEVVRASLFAAFSEYSHLHFFHPVQLQSILETENSIDLTTTDGQLFSARLVIGADGAQSWVREQMQISLKKWDYDHTALVTTVRSELPHQATAWQRFLPRGPLAFLPLKDPHLSSIVWSTTPEHATELLALNETEFCHELEKNFDYKLGKILKIDTRFHFPLAFRHAMQYVKSRVVLVGDAAHTIHPLIGQGVNLGLLDATCLSEVIADAINKNKDFTSTSILRRYERWRKADNFVMLTMADMLKKIFVNENQLVKSLRKSTLSLTNRITPIKNFFRNYAVGHGTGLKLSS